MEEIYSQGGKLDLVVVTHIDGDHIDGILYLLKLQDRGNPVPSIGALWHNSWPVPAPSQAGRREGPGAQIRPTRLSGPLNMDSFKDRLSYSVEQAREVYELTRARR
jgi:phosphoribosyl 1,2-cyclic phosphodiesterase